MDLKKAAAKEKETAVYFFEFLRTLVPEFYTNGQSQTNGQTQSALVPLLYLGSLLRKLLLRCLMEYE